MSQTKKRVFVGDVQGCLDELKALLSVVGFANDTHELWCVGDVVNRGPRSADTVRFLIDIKANTVLGNHDLHLISADTGARPLKKRDTFQDILQAPDKDELISWIKHRPLLKQWDDVVLVHAGVPNDYPDRLEIVNKLETQIANGQVPWHDPLLLFLTTVRLCNENGKLEKGFTAHDGFKPWHEFYTGDKIVVSGHWAQRGLHDTEKCKGLDTGCVWGRKLTAWVAEDNALYSVDAKGVYQSI